MLSQSVLLSGVNDDPQALGALMRALVECRIKPYYLHHGDLAPGTSHLRTSIEHGQDLMRALRGRLSGLCQPTYVLDIPGGHGKSPIGPNYLSRERRRPHPRSRTSTERCIAIRRRRDRTARALKPHPEGGHYRETFKRSGMTTRGRAASTAIYFLLKRGERSHWHRVDAVEAWHWYAGSALQLQINRRPRPRTCGSALISPPASARRRWCRRMPGRPPRASATGRLVGCTVAPGFEFTGFEVAPEGWTPA